MHKVFTALLLPAILLLNSCNEQAEYISLYAGSTPTITIENEAGSKIIRPQSLFLQLTSDGIEFNNNSYGYKIADENEQTITLTTSLPINDDLIVGNLVYDRSSGNLTLAIKNRDGHITLEKYDSMIERKVQQFVEVKLTSDISHLSDNQKEMLKLLFQVADIMEDIYWSQVFPDKDAVLAGIMDPNLAKFFKINYGPWERLNGDLPYMQGYGDKPAGSGFYPVNMTVQEFEELENKDKTSLYTLIERDGQGKLKVVPYHLAYEPEVTQAAELLKKASALAEDPGFKKYLNLRANALLTDDYYASDMAWMDMKDNDIDFIAGPIENYEDKLFNYKAAHESFLLIRDTVWSEKLNFVAGLLPRLQKDLPVSANYRKEIPGSSSDLGVYDAIYYAGDCNAGSKTIAINLPNDERVQAVKGSRKLQLKNSIRYKFEEILVPISNVLIAEDQRSHIKFDAFFENVMYHEVAHGLGLNHTINGKGTVREALKEQNSALEEGKADILGLYLITRLKEMGITPDKDLMDNYVTFMAGIFRSVRFGAASSHGKANMVRFYYFQEMGAFSRDPETGTYRVNFEKMQVAMNELAKMILMIQGDGDYEAARALIEDKGYIRDELKEDLSKLSNLNIPVDIVFAQGPEILGL